MGMARCYSLMKCLLILFSVILLAVGMGACGAAGWALWDGRASESGAGRAGLAAAAAWAAALALGAAAALAGAARRSAPLLAAAAALLALTAVAEAAAACWGSQHLPQLRRALTERLDHTVRVDYGVLPARTHMLDAIQRGLECCGSEGGPRDWQYSAYSQARSGAGQGRAGAALDLTVLSAGAYYHVPASCCAVEGPECEAARRVAAASRGSAPLHGAACVPRVLAALERGARAPLCALAALLAAHAAALLLAAALSLRPEPASRYKA